MAITFDSSTRTFYLDGKNISYVFFINEYGYAEHLYFGKHIDHDDLSYTREVGVHSFPVKIPCTEDRSKYCFYNQFKTELSFYGTGDYREPTVAVKNEQGDRLVELLYEGYQILSSKPKISAMPSMSGDETLVVYLRDAVTNFSCELYYTVYDDCDVIARRIVYKNGAENPVILNRAYSFALSLPSGREYELLSLHGAWATERAVQRTCLPYGVTSIDSKRTTSSAILNPFVAVVDRSTDEFQGNAYGVSLIYSSSYVLKAEKNESGNVLLTGGINDFDFSWKLDVGERFETPEIVIAYSDAGIGGMSRQFHDAYRNHLINPRFVNAPRPVVINNWEATYFNFDNEKLKAIAKSVEGTGIDTFVLDDGWFGKRYDDRSGLGDWVVNEKKLQGGLTEISNYVHKLGMKFGLWFEPEMISEDSDLYRLHPDFAIGVPRRNRCTSRTQYMLDLTRKEVRDYIVESVNRILRENQIEYVKWDYNRNVTESFSIGLDAERQSEFAHRYVLGVYDLCNRIVKANPNIFFEGCSGGGARFDPAMLYYFSQIWTSDDTDAEERTKIQYGTSIVYPLSTMSCHVSVVPNHQTGRKTSMKTRADIAHLGATGYELDTTNFTEEECSAVKAQIQEFRSIENLVLNGNLYRTENIFESNYFGFMLVSKDKKEAHLTVYRRMGGAQIETKFLRVLGLDEHKKYFVSKLDQVFSGATLMNVGLLADFGQGDFITATYHFTEV